MKPKSVIVIGAGIGGITAATHLAGSGLHVTVLEKNDHPGGCCDRMSRAGHHYLYFVGASTHPGTGIPTSIVSGRLVSKRIIDDHGI
jgi:phytoene dehydrogenase-like protein